MGKTSLVLDMVDVQEHDSGWRWNKFLLGGCRVKSWPNAYVASKQLEKGKDIQQKYRVLALLAKQRNSFLFETGTVIAEIFVRVKISYSSVCQLS